MNRGIVWIWILSAVALGCGDEGFYDPSPELIIAGVAAFDGSVSCEPSDYLDGPFLSQSAMDMLLTRRLATTFIFQNRDPHSVFIAEARVTFKTYVPLIKNALSIPHTIPIARRFSPGSHALDLELINEVLGRELYGTHLFVQNGTLVTIVANITLVGQAEDGEPLESPPFVLPIDVCTECLVEYLPDVLFKDEGGEWSCDPERHPSPELSPPIKPVCNLGQNEMFDCRLCHMEDREGFPEHPSCY